MVKHRVRPPPRWLFTILAVGGLVASGIHLGMIRCEGASTGHVLRSLGYGVFGILMLWGVLAKRKE